MTAQVRPSMQCRAQNRADEMIDDPLDYNAQLDHVGSGACTARCSGD